MFIIIDGVLYLFFVPEFDKMREKGKFLRICKYIFIVTIVILSLNPSIHGIYLE